MDQLSMKIKFDDYWKPQLRAKLFFFFFFFYLIKPRFYYISAGLMRKPDTYSFDILVQLLGHYMY